MSQRAPCSAECCLHHSPLSLSKISEGPTKHAKLKLANRWLKKTGFFTGGCQQRAKCIGDQGFWMMQHCWVLHELRMINDDLSGCNMDALRKKHSVCFVSVYSPQLNYPSENDLNLKYPCCLEPFRLFLMFKGPVCNNWRFWRRNCDIKWSHLRLQSSFTHPPSTGFASELRCPANPNLHTPSLPSSLSVLLRNTCSGGIKAHTATFCVGPNTASLELFLFWTFV